jgi:hypothetical protein
MYGYYVNELRVFIFIYLFIYFYLFINFSKQSTNIPYRSETFGSEDFEMNKPVTYYICSIFVVSSTFQPITEPEITIKKLAGKCSTWKLLNLVGYFFISF